MMDYPFEILWSDAARLTFDRLPIDVQAGFFKQLPERVAKYAVLYEHKPADSISVGTVSHMHAPDWTMWLRMDTDYVVEDDEPVLYINELEELTKAEVDASVAAVHQRDDLINPTR